MMKSVGILGSVAGACVFLVACGGGGGGSAGIDDPTAKEAARITDPDDGAALVVAASGLIDLDQLPQAKSGVPGKSHRAGFLGKARVPEKQVTTESCDTGSVTFDDANGRSEFDNCTYSDSFNGYSFSAELDGVTIEACASGGWEGNTDCMGEFRYTFGESDEAFSARFSDSDGEDLRLALLLSSRDSEEFGSGFERYRSVLNGSLSFEDAGAGQGKLVAEFSNFRTDELYSTTDGSAQMSFNGTFGSNAGSVLTNCNSGKATYTTVSPIVTDSADNLVSGELNISSTSGGSANVRIEDNLVTITVNGVPKTYTQAQLESFCN